MTYLSTVPHRQDAAQTAAATTTTGPTASQRQSTAAATDTLSQQLWQQQPPQAGVSQHGDRCPHPHHGYVALVLWWIVTLANPWYQQVIYWWIQLSKVFYCWEIINHSQTEKIPISSLCVRFNIYIVQCGQHFFWTLVPFPVIFPQPRCMWMRGVLDSQWCHCKPLSLHRYTVYVNREKYL